jgi:hypothetical protein
LALEFLVFFPSLGMLKMSARSGRLFDPLRGIEAAIRLANADHVPYGFAQENAA